MKILKPKLVLFFLLFFLIQPLIAQELTERECRNYIEKHGDTKQKVDYIQELLDIIFVNATDEIRKNKKDEIIALGNQSLEISEKLDYTKGAIKSYNYLANIYNFYNVPNLYLKYKIKYAQNKKALAEIQAQEITEIKKAQAAKEAEIAALEQDKEKNASLIERKKAELEKTSKTLNQTMQKVKIKDDLIAINEDQLKQKDNLIEESLDSLQRQNLLNDSLKATNEAMIQANRIVELTLKAERDKNWIYALIGIIAGIVALFFALILIVMNKTRLKLAEKNRQIAIEKERSEELLLNILPAEMAMELKMNGFAKAQSFEQATVFFSDFKDFTKISEQLSPADLVSEIDVCFQAFDRIIEKP